ncbi:uncharacterized protein LTR77_008207 [Saxophila tyrrhenica]|uniref:Amino acid transporter n=1 Tax=Saxophila tyrrhenica TaxID=1690608 RepID=A0AAV9P5I0_9PEZI|nr:hypothetical protein LTR77_008207 [Saxophila tyrrhenica]
MADIQLQELNKQPGYTATPIKHEDDGFQDQPDLDRDYDPSHDKRDMYRLGKKQQLKRRFRYFSIAGYIIVLGNCWEFSIVTSVYSLANGGTGGAIWMTILVITGVFLTVVSMAEVASMAPTSGGNYAVGWFGLIAWQVSLSSCAYIFSNQILALITVVNPDFVGQGWQASLLTILSSLTAVLLSVFVMQKLDLAEGLAVVAHGLGFIAFIAILWVMGPGPNTNAYDVFFTFNDDYEWGSPGLAALVGLIGPIATFIGGDPAVHLAEELQDASYVLPRAMVSASGVNYLIGFIALISFVFNLGPLDDPHLWDYNEQPWVAVIYRITGSKAATIVFIVIILINFFTLQVNSVMTSSRQLWAFARDKALPYSEWLARVHTDGIPRNAVVVTMVVAALLSLIVIGSTVAFNIILSISTAGAYACYICILSTIIYRRFDGNDFPPTRYSLGRMGLPINIAALVYLIVAFIFIFFPYKPNPKPDEMNWACLMFGSLIILSFSWYFYKARKVYDGPVEYVRRDVQEIM